MMCSNCEDRVRDGRIVCGDILCAACFHDIYGSGETPLDTPSLQDSNPEGWAYMHNVNPWGMEGGY